MADKTDDLVIGVSTDLSSVQRAIKKLDGDIARAGSQIERRFAAVGKSIDKAMPTGMQDRINKMVGVQVAATKEWTGALANQSKEMDRLRAKFSPMFSTITNYKTAVNEIRAAHRLGAISADEMAAAIQRERQAALSSIAAIKQRNAALAGSRGPNSFNTANIAAQFQDIGVTAAMGMSPLQIALQQGTQLSAILEQMKSSGQSAGATLLSAFTSIISPISLVTIGVVGLTAAAVQMSSTFLSGSKDVKDALSEHQKAVSDLRKAYGLAGDGAEDYGRRSIAALEAAERRARAILRDSIAAQEKQIRGQFSDFGFSGFGLLQRFGLVGDGDLAAVGAKFTAFAEPIRKLRQEIRDGKPDYDAFQQALEKIVSTDPGRLQPIADEIAGIVDEAATGREKIDDLNAALGGLSQADLDASHIISQIYGISEAAMEANKDIGALRRMLEGMGSDNSKGDRLGLPSMDQLQSQFRDQLNLWRRFGYDDDSGIDPNNPKKTRAPKPKIPKKTADDRFFEDIEAIKQRTIALAEERAQLGLSYEAQVKRKTAFDLEQKALKDVREAARQKGDQDWQNAQLTPEMIQKIDEASAAYARQAEELRKAQENMAFAKDITRGFLDDFVQSLKEGESVWESFGDAALGVLQKIADKLLEMATNDLINSIFAGGGGGGGLLSLLGIGSGIGGGSWAAANAGFATGTANTGGRRGEPRGVVHGQEAVIPLPNGGKVPVQIQAPVAPKFAMAEASGTVNAPVNINIDATGADREGLMRVEQQVAKLRQEVPSMVISNVRKAQKSNVKLG